MEFPEESRSAEEEAIQASVVMAVVEEEVLDLDLVGFQEEAVALNRQDRLLHHRHKELACFLSVRELVLRLLVRSDDETVHQEKHVGK